VIDASGNLYGATNYGGTGDCDVFGTFPGCGTVYELSPPKEKGGAWTEQVLYSFQGGSDGFVPFGDLVVDSSGNLYGTTQFGGGRGTNCGDDLYPYCGTVFELSPPKVQGSPWTEQILYSFEGMTSGGTLGHGARPSGGMIFDRAGNLYGTTQIGGSGKVTGNGTVFRLAPPTKPGETWTETVIHRFEGPDGDCPIGDLLLDKYGNLYGTTEFGGDSRYPSGEVFELSAQSNDEWKIKLVYSFYDGTDGSAPEAGVISDAAGSLYGTATQGGGTGSGGTVFELRPTAAETRSFELLHFFPGYPDGSNPASRLMFDPSGNIFGSAEYQSYDSGSLCGSFGCGVIFEITPP